VFIRGCYFPIPAQGRWDKNRPRLFSIHLPLKLSVATAHLPSGGKHLARACFGLCRVPWMSMKRGMKAKFMSALLLPGGAAQARCEKDAHGTAL
jgi:hypothetical protein